MKKTGLNAHCLALEKKLSFPFSQITTELLFKVQLRAERRQVLLKVKDLGALAGLDWDFWRGFLFAFIVEQ